MIPKIIHYCWLSDDPFPEHIQNCIDSWKKHLPDYELMLWNFDRFPRGKSKWVDQAFDYHKYAFAADNIRLYALYKYGGIYLDSDVEVLKSFNDLLHLPYFIGKEKTPSGIEASTLGFEPGNELIKNLLDWFEDRSFINDDGSCRTEPLPYLFRKCIEAYYQYNEISNTNEFLNDTNIINVLPDDWFSPKQWMTKEIIITSNTYSVHHFAGSWMSKVVTKKAPVANSYKKKINALFCGIPKRIKMTFAQKALTNSYFATLYFCLLHLLKMDRFFFPDKRFFIYFSDFKKIAFLGKPLSNCQFEIIKREESIHKDSINYFYPIARVCNSSIEIHVCDIMEHVYSKSDILSLLKHL